MKILIQWHEAFRWFLVFALTGYAIWAWNAEAGDVTAQQPAMTGDFESLRSLLETRGWRVERTPDGSTLLFPLRDTPQAQGNMPQTQKPAAASVTLTVTSEDMPKLHELLEAYSWNQVQKSSNALHLMAPAHPQTLPTTTKVECAEEPLDLVLTAGIKLPVNTTEEAWQISENWLWASGYTGLDVGHIRSINWVYLVKIVDQNPPYRSRNQLIINKRNGQVLPLY